MGCLFPERKHQHKECIERVRSSAIELVNRSGRKFGANQLRVFDTLLQDHNATSAYDLVERIARCGKRLQPVQVYRALDGLIEIGIVHRVQSRNAYVACDSLGDCHNPQFLLCSSCNRVAELASNTVASVISKTAKQANFVLQQGLVELIGLCPDCAENQNEQKPI